MSIFRRAMVLLLCVLLSTQGTAFARHLDNGNRHHNSRAHAPLATPVIATAIQRDQMVQSKAIPCSSKSGCLSAAQLAMLSKWAPAALDFRPTASATAEQSHASISPQPPEHRPRPLTA